MYIVAQRCVCEGWLGMHICSRRVRKIEEKRDKMSARWRKCLLGFLDGALFGDARVCVKSSSIKLNLEGKGLPVQTVFNRVTCTLLELIDYFWVLQ